MDGNRIPLDGRDTAWVIGYPFIITTLPKPLHVDVVNPLIVIVQLDHDAVANLQRRRVLYGEGCGSSGHVVISNADPRRLLLGRFSFRGLLFGRESITIDRQGDRCPA